MNKKPLLIISIALAAVSAISLASAISLSSKNKEAQAELQLLQAQLIDLQAATPIAAPEPEIIYLTAEGNTNEVTALKSELAKAVAMLETAKTSATNRPPRQRESGEDRMAKMKAEKPEEYAAMLQKRQERQEEMKYNLAERTATFMDLDTSNMTAEELANHDLLVEKMSKVWELTASLEDPEATPDRESMREMFETINDARPLMEQERTVMFKQLATDIGYTGDDSAAFAEHLEEIISTTTIQMPNRGGRGGRGGGGR
jgi:selenocysteine-specific translation elongation factor